MTWWGSSGDRDAPAAGARAGAGHAEVLQPAGDEAEHLVAPCGRFDAQLATTHQLAQPLLVAGEPEEPVLLGDQLRLEVVVGAAAAAKLRLRVELLAADAVQPLVVLAVEVAGGGARPP
jgi:hypothetical protein